MTALKPSDSPEEVGDPSRRTTGADTPWATEGFRGRAEHESVFDDY